MKIYFQTYIENYGDPLQRQALKSRVTTIRKRLLKHAPDILLLNKTTRELHQYLLPKYHEVAFLEDEISQDLPPEKRPGMAILVNDFSKLVCERWSRIGDSKSIHAKISGINFIIHPETSKCEPSVNQIISNHPDYILTCDVKFERVNR